MNTDTMATTHPDTIRPATSRLPLAVFPLAGAVLAMLALIAALLVGPGGTRVPAAVLGGTAVVALGVELTRRAVRLMRTAGAPMVGLVGLSALVVTAALWLAATANLASLGIGAVLAVFAGGLIGWGTHSLGELRRQERTPWQQLAGRTRHDTARRIVAGASPLLVGSLLALIGIRMASLQFAGTGQPGSVVATIMVFAATVAAIAFAVVRWLRPLRIAETRRTSSQIAGHLHDSVLQTLALIQRSASDPARVAQLARQQERSLRDWLAGRDEQSAATTLADAIRGAAREVEDDVVGATVDVVVVGDKALDRRASMLVQAAREAMRNAARHGTPQVRVFVESDNATTTVYVRDTGAGFRLDDIPADRRGVRDAIIGRMEHVGGTVTLHSGLDGTEVELTLPHPSA